MRTAIDTNVLSALRSKEPSASDIAKILATQKRRRSCCQRASVCGIAGLSEGDSIIRELTTGIAVDFEFHEPVWVEAGRRFAHYAKRRRRSAHQAPKRLLADFIIGSHALAQSDRFMTLDPKRYERDFPELKLI